MSYYFLGNKNEYNSKDKSARKQNFCVNCLKFAEWKGGVLQCDKCKRMIALRYMIGDDIKLYIFPKFKKYKKEIEKRKDTFHIVDNDNILGKINFDEFNDLIRKDVQNG